MLTTLFLHGTPGKRWGREWKFDTTTPAELLRSLIYFKPDFAEYLVESGNKGVTFRVVVDGKEVSFYERLVARFKSEVHLYPIPIGSKRQGTGQTIIGAVLVVAAVAYAAYTGGAGASTISKAAALAFKGGAGGWAQFAALMGTSMFFGGISQMIANPKFDFEKGESKRSYLFSGAQSTSRQGAAVPVGYGKLHVGPVLVSAGMFAERLEVPTTNAGVDTDGDGIPDDFDGDGLPDGGEVE